MFSLLLRPSPDREEYVAGELWEGGTTGIVEDESSIRAFFNPTSDRAGLLHRFAAFQPELREEPAVDWTRATYEAWPPLAVGRRFYLAPPWCSEPTPEG